jgi:hypothetical protein
MEKRERKVRAGARESTAQWTAERWSDWLTEGLLHWHDPAAGPSKRLRAFHPLSVPGMVDDVISYLQEALSVGPHRNQLIHGTSLALRRWQPILGNKILTELLHFAEVYWPINAVDEIGRMTILSALEAIQNRELRHEATSQLVTTLAIVANEKEDIEALNATETELKKRGLWHVEFEARARLARAKANPEKWDELLASAIDVVRESLSDGDDWMIFLENFVSIVGLRRIVERLLELRPDLTRFEERRKQIDELFSPADPSKAILRFEGRIRFLNEKWPDPLEYERLDDDDKYDLTRQIVALDEAIKAHEQARRAQSNDHQPGAIVQIDQFRDAFNSRRGRIET